MMLPLLLLSSLLSPTHSQCSSQWCDPNFTDPPNMNSALRGYDPVQGTRTNGDEDPGTRSPIFQGTVFTEHGFEKRDFVETNTINRCHLTSKQEHYNNYKDYVHGTKSLVESSSSYSNSFSTSFGLPWFDLSVNFEYSNSNTESEEDNTEEEERFFSETQGEIYLTEGECRQYTVEVNLFSKPTFTSSFIGGLRSLQRHYSNPANQDDLAHIKLFFDQFGTHYMKKTYLGATVTTEVRYASSARSEEDRNQRSQCSSRAHSYSVGGGVSGGVGGGTISVSAQHAAETAARECKDDATETEFFNSGSTRETVVYSSGTPPQDDVVAWANAVKDNEPVPVSFKLESISELLRPEWIDHLPLEPTSKTLRTNCPVLEAIADLSFDLPFNTTQLDDYLPDNCLSPEILASSADEVKLNSTLLRELYLRGTQNYCLMYLGRECEVATGCGLVGSCGYDEVCLHDESKPQGFKCETKSAILITGGYDVHDDDDPPTMIAEVWTADGERRCSLPRINSGHQWIGHTVTGHLMCGGVFGKNCWKFEFNEWREIARLREKRVYHVSWDLGEEGVMLLGGLETRDTAVLVTPGGDIQDQTWTLQYDSTHSCGVDLGDSVLITGGASSRDHAVATVHEYNKQGHVRDWPRMRDARREHGCASYWNSEHRRVILVTGGWNYDKRHEGGVKTTELMVEGESYWRPAGSLSTGVRRLSGATLNNEVFMFGGSHLNPRQHGFLEYLDRKTILRFKKTGQYWEEVGEMSIGRSLHAVGLIKYGTFESTGHCA